MTPDPNFNIVPLFDVKYLRSDTRKSHVYYRPLIERYVICGLLDCAIDNDLD